MNPPVDRTAEVEIVALAGLRLPDTGILRDHTRPPDRRTEHYLDRYDRQTLFYDCVYLEAEQGYLFTAPRFLNFWAPFRSGLRRDGKPVRRLRRVKWLRCEQVFLPGPRGALTVEMDGITYPLAPREGLAPEFTGMNALVAVSKNNHLDWIADWAAFHVTDHAAEAVAIFDNGSDAYSLQDLADALAAVPGLKRAVVYSAPFPYGPADKSGRFDVSPRFFQSAMLNLARRDALARTRAVLSIDIDELVSGPEGASVFDAAVKNAVGMITIQGRWVYPDPATDRPVPQREHGFRAEPDKKCNRKWCATPGGAMSRLFGWAVHQIGGIAQNLFTNQTAFRLNHCRGCSTGWKATRFQFPDPLVPDEALRALMRRHFGA